jgi:ParB family chromosome partitioning protein
MNAPVQKITLSSSRDIPFCKLVLSQSNVRRVKSGLSIEDLAASIARRGLIQSLHVRPVLDDRGAETGMFEVPAGGRRFRALELLVKQKRLSKSAPVPCVVSDANDDVLIEEVSLAENIDRAPLHPLDQYRAFRALRDKGMTDDAIAAAFFVTPQAVKQRLRLVTVSPVLLDIYAEDGMTLEQLMAFSVSNDHARQEQVWQTVGKSWQSEPWQIRRMLTESTVQGTDRRARFVGAEAYEAADGVILRDLFNADNGGWFQDVALLDRMAAEKLKVLAEKVAMEGWKWIEAGISLPYGVQDGLRKLAAVSAELSDDDDRRFRELTEEYDRIEAEYEGAEELPDAVDARLGEIETTLLSYENRPLIFDPADIANAGAFIYLNSDGQPVIERGFVRLEDEVSDETPTDAAAEKAADRLDPDTQDENMPKAQPTSITVGGQPVSPAGDEEEDALKPIPERLLQELTAFRTVALRNALAENPQVAMTALLHQLVSLTFNLRHGGTALEVNVHKASFAAQSDDLKDSLSAVAITDRQARWADHIPADDDALWDWLTAQSDGTRFELLAHCVSFGVNALFEKINPYGAGISAQGLRVRMAHADRLVQATDLDLVEAGWRPTVENYLGRVTKGHILEAVREGAGDRASDLIAHLKKGDMAKEAERLLADSGWLPGPLRSAHLDADANPADAVAVTEEENDLPAFLGAPVRPPDPEECVSAEATQAAE